MDGLAIVEGLDHVCCRYRVRAFLPALEQAGVALRIEALRRSPAGRIGQLLGASRYDMVLLQRKLLPSWQLGLLRSRARRLVFDFDDAVLYRDSYDPRGPDCPRRAARFARTVQAADLVVAGNDFLADCARRAGAPADRVRVIPTCIDTDRLRPIDDPIPRPSGLRLAWIGSSSTLQGLERERPLLVALGRSIPGLSLRMICDRFAEFDPLRVEAVRWSEAGEADALATSDVGISLIPDDLWSRGKCGLKVLQYLACGLPVVANPVGVHPEMVHDGVNGFLPATPEDWIGAIRRLAGRPGQLAEMGREARRVAVERYSIRSWAPAFVSALTGLPVRPRPDARGRSREPAAAVRG
jgi:glycosyltransferase involved in cell wall biosynthesis